MTYREQRIQQLQIELDWLKNKLKTIIKNRYRKEISHQIKQHEYEIELGIFREKD